MPVCKYPMTGRQRTTTSPSRTSSSRKTPCVDGCCGPMLTVSSSRVSVPSADSSGDVSVPTIDAPCDGEVDGLCAERFGAPQRMPEPVVGHHEPPQVRMAVEADAEQIEHLALVPVGARDDRRDARRLGVRARLEAQPGVS